MMPAVLTSAAASSDPADTTEGTLGLSFKSRYFLLQLANATAAVAKTKIYFFIFLN